VYRLVVDRLGGLGFGLSVVVGVDSVKPVGWVDAGSEVSSLAAGGWTRRWPGYVRLLPLSPRIPTRSSSTACWRCNTSRKKAWSDPGAPRMPRAGVRHGRRDAPAEFPPVLQAGLDPPQDEP